MRMLDLFCGRLGWSKAFLARGWECVGVDILPVPIVEGADLSSFTYIRGDILDMGLHWVIQRHFDFICASSPCDEFACFQMRHFRPNPPFPEAGIKLFNHTRSICEASGVPYVLENVRAAQEFVGKAVGKAGSFHLWGNAVPPVLPTVYKAKWFRRDGKPGNFAKELLLKKSERKPLLATIPPELSNCVADYAERLLEQLATSRGPSPKN
jgi:hypothetical protein